MDRVEASKEQGLPARGRLEAARSSVLPVVEAGARGYPGNRGLPSGRAAVGPTVSTVGETPAERKMKRPISGRRTPRHPCSAIPSTGAHRRQREAELKRRGPSRKGAPGAERPLGAKLGQSLGSPAVWGWDLVTSAAGPTGQEPEGGPR